MYNLVHFFIGFLAELGFISPEGAKAVDRELSPQIISSSSQEAFQQVHLAMEKVAKELNLRGDIVKIEPWITEIRLLEAKVKELESKHNAILEEFNHLKTINIRTLSEEFGSSLNKVVATTEAKAKKVVAKPKA